MKNFLALSFSYILILSASAQITKKNWLVGGNASFYYTNNYIDGTSDYINKNLTISPNVGYFLFDKFCAGINLSFNRIRNDYPFNPANGIFSYESTVKSYSVGPFVRYYLLDKQKLANLFIESNYQYAFRRYISSRNTGENKDVYDIISLKGGPVIFLNESIAIELSLGYSLLKYEGINRRSSTIQTSLGLQIHLQKND